MKWMWMIRVVLFVMEGGLRSNKWGERWFKVELNFYLVVRIGGKGWNFGLDFDEFLILLSLLKRSLMKSFVGEGMFFEVFLVKLKKVVGKWGRKFKV